MRYLINVRVDGTKKRTYPVEAADETQAKERLLLRLPPHQRETLIVDEIKIDPASLVNADPYGIFGEE
ncbi:hypothetical protein LOH54_08215 [Sulfurimonas sp. HSL-3221]|uniref:hypothetical protein n=1 Tax=Sulfurimonadaceae TaxID=2771471 RepID=UPI001E366534|nr:hypothetical protein [Sulfurimonas sp. HSL-3221]UFS61647.1 hypothetical protein LOH54_08215 [Sulfurimonas sp. HSL-3221]